MPMLATTTLRAPRLEDLGWRGWTMVEAKIANVRFPALVQECKEARRASSITSETAASENLYVERAHPLIEVVHSVACGGWRHYCKDFSASSPMRQDNTQLGNSVRKLGRDIGALVAGRSSRRVESMLDGPR